MKTKELIKDFEEHLYEKHLAENTVRSYTFAARQFFKKFRKINIENLNLYKVFLIDNYKPQTVNNRIRAINCLMDYLEDAPAYAEWYKPMKHLTTIKLQQKTYLENVISKSDYEYLKKSLKRDDFMRWYFVVHFLGSTGVRVSELIQMKIEHLELGYMDICSKAGKARRVLIPDRLCKEALAWYYSQGITSGFIFLNNKGNVITPRGIGSQLKYYAGKYTIEESTVYPLSFRHRFAKYFLEKSSDIALLADLLGHDSIETTRIYLKKTGSEQMSMINKIVTW